MYNKLAAVAITALMPVGVAISSPGVAHATVAPQGPIAAQAKVKGTVTCDEVTGSFKFEPQLTLAGAPGGVKYTVKATSSDCSSQARLGTKIVTITGMTVTGSGYWNQTSGPSGNSCASLTTDELGVGVKMKYVWTSIPAIPDTTVTTKHGEPWVVNGSILNFELPGGAPVAVITASTGSFAPVVTQSWNVDTDIAYPCSTSWGPYPTATITSGTITVA